jgi:hypothetical protein
LTTHNGLRQRTFVCTHDDRVTLRSARLTDNPAGLTLREPVLLTSPRNRLPAPFGAYKFPEAISLRTRFSNGGLDHDLYQQIRVGELRLDGGAGRRVARRDP